MRHGSAEIGRRLRLTFSNITEADFLAILNHYRGQRSGFDSFGFTTSTLAADRTPSGYAWLYASPPQVVDDHADCFTVTCEFKCEPRGLVVAPGKAWRSLSQFFFANNPGARWSSTTTFTPGLGVPPVTLTWATGTSDLTYSNSNTTITATRTAQKVARSYASRSSGKWYAEISIVTNSSGETYWGVGANTSNPPGFSGTSGVGICAGMSIEQDLSITPSGSTLSYSSGALLMLAVDFDAKKLWFGANGSWLASGNPATGANPSASGWSSSPTWYVILAPYRNADAGTLQAMPNYEVPSGFSRWSDS